MLREGAWRQLDGAESSATEANGPNAQDCRVWGRKSGKRNQIGGDRNLMVREP